MVQNQYTIYIYIILDNNVVSPNDSLYNDTKYGNVLRREVIIVQNSKRFSFNNEAFLTNTVVPK